jgi:hypothetical protein
MLTYQEREAEIERGDGEVLLMLNTNVEKGGAHLDQFKMAKDGKVQACLIVLFHYYMLTQLIDRSGAAAVRGPQ